MSKFEDHIELIDLELAKRKKTWTLTSIQWLDWDDVAQLVRLHIYEKWSLYDDSKPLAPWLNKVIGHQIKNIIRNLYGNYTKPCLKCSAAEGDNGCKIYSSQCGGCPLYAAWEKSRKQAYNIKVPVSFDVLENNETEHLDNQDIDSAAEKIHVAMKDKLKPQEWLVYKHLFIDHLPENDLALKLGFKTSENGRNPGYRQLRNIRKKIIDKVKKALKNDEIDIL